MAGQNSHQQRAQSPAEGEVVVGRSSAGVRLQGMSHQDKGVRGASELGASWVGWPGICEWRELKGGGGGEACEQVTAIWRRGS